MSLLHLSPLGSRFSIATSLAGGAGKCGGALALNQFGDPASLSSLVDRAFRVGISGGAFRDISATSPNTTSPTRVAVADILGKATTDGPGLGPTNADGKEVSDPAVEEDVRIVHRTG